VHAVLAALLCLLLTAVPPQATAKQELWPDGTLKARWSVDAQGRTDGTREEYTATGVRTLLAEYTRGKRNGAWREWTPTGERVRFLNYRDDLQDGRCEEFEPGTQRRTSAEWKAGALHGERKVYDKDRVLSKQRWKEGELVDLDGRQPFPVRREVLLSELRAILAQPTTEDPKDPKAVERQRALHRLQVYRRLCGLPWQGMQLVPEWNLHCDAASEVCRANGELDHTPPKPSGFDEARYKLGYEGASNSNLSRGSSLPRSIDGYMDDSDPSNIDRIGHRRWCLNPAMKKTGFGSDAEFSAMWSMDGSGSAPKGLDTVCYPPKGHVPVDLYSADRAFSIALWKSGEPRQDQLVVRIWLLDENWLTTGEPLDLDWCKVAGGGYGGAPCLVFRAPRMKVAPGVSYRVRVSVDGGKTDAHDYIVSFCEPVSTQ
jgi:hypothetical protein